MLGIHRLHRDLDRLGLSEKELETAYIGAVEAVVQLQQERG